MIAYRSDEKEKVKVKAIRVRVEGRVGKRYSTEQCNVVRSVEDNLLSTSAKLLRGKVVVVECYCCCEQR